LPDAPTGRHCPKLFIQICPPKGEIGQIIFKIQTALQAPVLTRGTKNDSFNKNFPGGFYAIIPLLTHGKHA
jgi:hypothetical protein